LKPRMGVTSSRLKQVTQMPSNCPVPDAPVQEDESAHLRELGDPEFFTHWATVRARLFQSPEDAEVKRRYDTVKAEFRRRIDGGLAVSVDN
jgi:hypothetical protein